MSRATLLEFPGYVTANKDIAAYLRELADHFEHPDTEQLHSLVILVETQDGRINRSHAGKPQDLARVVGLLTMAAAQASTRVRDDE